MLRIALLIVLVMAGSPAGSLACEPWCNSPAGEAHHRAVGCHDAAAMTPFVAEVRHPERALVGTPTAARFDTSSIARDHEETTTGWGVCNARPLPRPCSSRIVLRV